MTRNIHATLAQYPRNTTRCNLFCWQFATQEYDAAGSVQRGVREVDEAMSVIALELEAGLSVKLSRVRLWLGVATDATCIPRSLRVARRPKRDETHV